MAEVGRMRSARRHVLAAALCAGVLASGGARLRADDPAPAWAPDVVALRLEPDPAKRLERTWALLAMKPDVAALRAELGRPLPWKADAPKDMTHWEREVEKAGRLTVFAYVPQAYTPEKAWPVLVWMHGAVAREDDGGGLGGLGLLREEGEAKGFLVLSPSATKDCTWWSAAGTRHLRACLSELARRYRVDPDRVAAAGFSDGGSGCYHLALHDPDPYACFLSWMGHPLVSATGGGPAFVGNGAARPVWAVNGAEDALYPADRVKPFVETLTKGGMAIEWRALPDADHDPVNVGAELEAALAFWSTRPRVPLPKVVDWECVVPANDGRRAWIEVLEVNPGAPGAPDLAS
jgi:poly(3-hydroxybutyrate) depolymerase